VGDKVEVVGLRATRDTVVTGGGMFRKSMDEAIAGDNIGLLGWRRKTWAGMVVCQPKSIAAHQVQDSGGVPRRKGAHTPFFNRHRPQFYFRTRT
jgi:elongation factor Tu